MQHGKVGKAVFLLPILRDSIISQVLHYITLPRHSGGLSESEISHSMGNLVVRVGGYPVENVKNWCLEDDPLRSKWSLFRGHLLISQGAEAGNKRSILESYLRLSLFSRGCCSFKKILRNKHFTTQVYGVSGFYWHPFRYWSPDFSSIYCTTSSSKCA